MQRSHALMQVLGRLAADLCAPPAERDKAEAAWWVCPGDPAALPFLPKWRSTHTVPQRSGSAVRGRPRAKT